MVFLVLSAKAQKLPERELFDAIRKHRLDTIQESDFFPQNPTRIFLKQQYQILTGNGAKVDSTNPGFKDSVYYYLSIGDSYTLNQRSANSDSIAYTNYLRALNLSTSKNDIILQCEALKRMLLYHLKNQKTLDTFYDQALQYQDLAYDDFEKIYASYFLNGAKMALLFYRKLPQENIENDLLEKIKLAQEKKHLFLEARLNQILGAYKDILKQDDALVYYRNALNAYEQIPYYFSQKHISDMQFNIASYYSERDETDSALTYLRKINPEKIKRHDYKDRLMINNLYYETYKKIGKLDSALVYLEKTKKLQDTLKLEETAQAIIHFETKYQTEKKENENLTLKVDKIRTQNIALGLGGGLTAVSIITLLVYRDSKRKQRIAIQEKEIQKQKTNTILKEKEIETINAMVAGQEKERERLASDLHDNIGSTLATVRMHVDNLERNIDRVENPKELLKTTNHLIDEAYTKVRQISHERNAGVLAKDGLLPAVVKLAKTVSAANGVSVSVADFGLDKRLSNDLEITIFRIIQELITNIVKHANATEASVSLTQHEAELSIIIEDDGCGFKPGQLVVKDGMGLGSIERRIEHLDGSFQVDSSPQNGTTILIDIPL